MVRTASAVALLWVAAAQAEAPGANACSAGVSDTALLSVPLQPPCCDSASGGDEDALLASKLCSYAQGMAHLRAVSDAHGWELKLAELAAIWQGGCIIRAKVLNLVEAAFTKDPTLFNLLLDDAVAAELAKRVAGWPASFSWR